MNKFELSEAFESKDTRRHKKRMALLSAGAQLFNDRGFDRTTIDDIAEALNVTKRTLYYYVTSKEEILFECCRMGLQFMLDIVEECDKSNSSALEKIEQIIRGYVELLEGDMGACLVLSKDIPITDNNKRNILRDGHRTLDHIMRRIISAGIEDGTIKPCDPKLTTAAIFGALNWVPHWNRGPKHIAHTEIADNYIPLLLEGLRVK